MSEPTDEELGQAIVDKLTAAVVSLERADIAGASIAIDPKGRFCVVVTFGVPGAPVEQQISVCQKAMFALAAYTQNLQNLQAQGQSLAAAAAAQRTGRGYNDA